MKYHNLCVFFILTFLSGLLYPENGNTNSNNILQSQKWNNHIILLRHSTAPGFGDPENFELSDCQTQRNLSRNGINQAQIIGLFLKKNGYKKVIIYSSEWCRCKDTAKALNLGPYKTMHLLNSFFSNFAVEKEQTLALKKWIKNLPLSWPIILVTHQVNITALTGYVPAQGELVFVKRLENGEVTIIDSIRVEDSHL